VALNGGLLYHGVERGGLRQSARKAVENETVLARRCLNGFFNQTNQNLIRHEFALKKKKKKKKNLSKHNNQTTDSSLFFFFHNVYISFSSPSIHDRLDLFAKRRASGDGGAQHVARRQMAHIVLLLDQWRLRAFASTGRTC
jgi:hypothetical protein